MRKTSFNCPRCAEPLESPLEEAGTRFPCPVCGESLLVPGVEELNRVRAEAIRKAEEKALEATRKATVQKSMDLEREAREAQMIVDRDAIEARSAQKRETKRMELATQGNAHGVSPLALLLCLVASVLLTIAVVHQTMIKPLAEKLADTQSKLADTVAGLDSLTHTVNYNADVANRNSRFR